MSNLKKQLIKLGSTNPSLRGNIRPILAAMHTKKAGSPTLVMLQDSRTKDTKPIKIPILHGGTASQKGPLVSIEGILWDVKHYGSPSVTPVVEVPPHIFRKIRASKKASSWSDHPTGSDTAFDLIRAVENTDPLKASRLVEKELLSREFGDRYAAMGVWDLVMTSDVPAFVSVFAYLKDDVQKAARKGVPSGDDFEHNDEVYKWMKAWSHGVVLPGKNHRTKKFAPKKVGPLWYIQSVDVDGTDLLELTIDLKNQWTGETKTLHETMNPPMDVADFTIDIHGGKSSTQQSFVLRIEDYDGDNEYEAQVDLDSAEGEITTLGDWQQLSGSNDDW